MAIPEWTIVDFVHRGPWWKNRAILTLNLCLLLPILTAAVNGLDSSLVNGLQILPAWQEYFKHPTGKSLGLINCAQVIGSFVSMPFTPLVTDGLGRRKALTLGSTIMLGGVALQVMSKNAAMLIGSRILIGFGLAFALNAAPLLITELAYPTQRGKFTAIYNSSWYLGSVISAWICFSSYHEAGHSVWSWRIPTIAQCVIPIAQIILVWTIPESPRWLVSQGREGEACRILARFHSSDGDERDPLVVFEMAQIRHAIRIEKELHKETTWMSLVSTPGNRRRMMIVIAIAIFSQWSGNGLVSYYLHLILEGIGIADPSTQAAINGGLQVFNLAVALLGSFLVDKLGRRTLFLISNIGMLLDFIAWTLTTALFNTMEGEAHRAAAAKATIPFIFIFYFFYDLAYTALLVAYTIEILPYNIRARGFAVMNAVISLVLAFNQFVNPWALESMGWKYYLVYCGWLPLELLFIYKFVIETKGRTLEETATLFDGNMPVDEIVHRGGEAATMTMSRGPGELFDEIEHRLNALEGLEKHSRRATAEFHELKRTKSSATDSTIDRSSSGARMSDFSMYKRDSENQHV